MLNKIMEKFDGMVAIEESYKRKISKKEVKQFIESTITEVLKEIVPERLDMELESDYRCGFNEALRQINSNIEKVLL